MPGAEAEDFQWQLQPAYQSTDESGNEKITLGTAQRDTGPIDPETDDEGSATNLTPAVSSSGAPPTTLKPGAWTKRVVFVSHRPAWRTDAVRGLLYVSRHIH